MNRFFKMMLGILLSLGSFFAQADDEVITPKAASALYAEKKAVIVDVREDDEWNVEHIAGAIHIPLDRLADHLSELQAYKNTTIITQCRGGKRSVKALEILKSAGFANVYSLDGGIIAWSQQGLTTTK